MTKFIFDVDGTLTPSRGQIDKEFKTWFNIFCKENDVYLVTGSDRSKTIEQIGEDTYNLCKRAYQCSGNDVWQSDIHISTNDWILPEEPHEWLTGKLTESDFKIRTGLHFEHRPGMLNFSVVGRNASQADRASYVQYEQHISERQIIAKMFNFAFPKLQATVGGETGIDIAPRGFDKSQILRDFEDTDTIHFYGDAVFEGGNDKPLADALMSFAQLGFSHQVRGWEDTWEKLKEIT